MRDIGIEADIIIFHPYDRWGYCSMSAEQDFRYVAYLAARLAAYRNVWWSLANEYDFLLDTKPMSQWDRYFHIIEENDPYRHLKSIHNGDVTMNYDHRKPWVSHVCMQNWDVKRTFEWREDYGKPVVNDEPEYEGNIIQSWGNITRQELVHRFWITVMRGGYAGHGETYAHPRGPDLVGEGRCAAWRGVEAHRLPARPAGGGRQARLEPDGQARRVPVEPRLRRASMATCASSISASTSRSIWSTGLPPGGWRLRHRSHRHLEDDGHAGQKDRGAAAPPDAPWQRNSWPQAGCGLRRRTSGQAVPGYPRAQENLSEAKRCRPSQIRDVRKAFGASQVLHGVSVDIEDGEFVILVGPSGCGKSTLLRMIAGLESITGGQISDRRQDRQRSAAERSRHRDGVPELCALSADDGRAEHGLCAGNAQGSSKPEIKKKVDQAAAILGLQPLLERKPAQLSGGQRQRVAMGRAIVRDPKVFLFDEPLSNLDAKLRVQMRAEIKALQQRLNTTTVYVTHDQIEAMTMADKIVVMQGGRVEQIGAPLELYDRPANQFVAGFLGSPAMNFISGTLRADDGPKLELANGASIRIARLPTNADGRKVVFGIRPEDIRLNENGDAAKLVVVEPTGSETLLAIDFQGQELTCLLRERADLKPGQDVILSFASKAAHFFDLESGARID